MQSLRTESDPVSRAILTHTHNRFPIPLIATSYDINIKGGLADVTATRTFNNSERLSLEATLTFPLPVHAVLYELKAKVGDRVLKAVAKSKGAARETYEEAIDQGHMTVLHEELIKGVHMLSVGHLPPGARIEVEARFVLPLAMIGGTALLRIPTTVGDVYGASGLPDSDEIASGGTLLAGDVKLSCDSGTPKLFGGTLENGAARVWLDASIVVEIEGWTPRTLTGCAADGTPVSLAMKPAPNADANLDAAVLVDRSGSMAETCVSGARVTKHAAVLLGLDDAGRDLTEADRINLWEFSFGANDLGTARAGGWRALLLQLSIPDGGTEIGGSIAKVIAERQVRDILLITDGKSHALDINKLAASGVRFTVVLIGEDSLDANVGHLAMLTGGQIFVPGGVDVSAAVRSALKAMRAQRLATTSGTAIETCIGGMAVSAAWGSEASSAAPADPAWTRAVGAFCASLRLASLQPADGAALAEREGLVTHLTSLVLVDVDGKPQSGLPSTRKVALPSPAASVQAAIGGELMHAPARMHFGAARSGVLYSHSMSPRASASCGARMPESVSGPSTYARDILESSKPKVARADRAQLTVRGPANPGAHEEPSRIKSLSGLVGRINWHRDGERLSEGNMLKLPEDVADAIDAAAAHRAVRRTAKRLGLSARVLVIGLLAKAEAGRDRYADRVARAIFAKAKTRDVKPIAERLGLHR